MAEAVINITAEIRKHLPLELIDLVKTAGEIAQEQGQNLYLVGGVVRDILLERDIFDLDLVVEGNAIRVAQQIAEKTDGKLIVHERFGTAKVKKGKWSLDLAMARSETYAEPGALPTVQPGTIRQDLFRRDFTINAMAVELNPGRYGILLDPYGGRADLENKLVRVLHSRSFIDDATRIWRALRYEQRLGFTIEPHTLELLKRDLSYLDKISGDRIRRELELVLKEEQPEKVLRRADELGVLGKLHPALQGDKWLAEKFARAREAASTAVPIAPLYMALLCYRMTESKSEDLLAYLRLSRSMAQTVRDTHALKAELDLLSHPKVKSHDIHVLLCDYSIPAMAATIIATDSAIVRRKIKLFLDKLRYVKPSLGGEDLVKMGVKQGPHIKELLNLLLKARLEGQVNCKKEEEQMVAGWLREKQELKERE